LEVVPLQPPLSLEWLVCHGVALVAWQVTRDGGGTGERKAAVGCGIRTKEVRVDKGMGMLRKDGLKKIKINMHVTFAFTAGLLNFVQKLKMRPCR
jgi:hypothetical protein